jgi:hypothetical protein
VSTLADELIRNPRQLGTELIPTSRRRRPRGDIVILVEDNNAVWKNVELLRLRDARVTAAAI